MSTKETKGEAIQKEKLALDNDIFQGQDNRRDRPEYFMPPGTEVLKVFDYLEIDLGMQSKRYKGRASTAIFTLFWNIFVIGFMIVGLGTGEVMIVAVALFFMMFGGMLGYKTLQSYFNKRKIMIQNGEIRISESPFNLLKTDVVLEAEDIEQLYVSKYFTGIRINNERVMAYSLSAITKEKNSIRLVEESSLETVLYLEQEIERFLNINDYPVQGEIMKENE